MRRRCSNLTRAALEVAHVCLDDGSASDVRSIFASRHGESEVTVRTLTELAKGNPLSPNDFSLSVHNTSSGLFSIFSKNTQASTAVAGGRHSLDALFLEVFSSLASAPTTPVHAVIADMPCPKEFGSLKRNPCYALAFVLRAGGGEDALEFRFDGSPIDAEKEDSPETQIRTAVEDFLLWAFTPEKQDPFTSKESGWCISARANWRSKFRPIQGVVKEAA